METLTVEYAKINVAGTANVLCPVCKKPHKNVAAVKAHCRLTHKTRVVVLNAPEVRRGPRQGAMTGDGTRTAAIDRRNAVRQHLERLFSDLMDIVGERITGKQALAIRQRLFDKATLDPLA
jgi:hypothetical protein